MFPESISDTEPGVTADAGDAHPSSDGPSSADATQDPPEQEQPKAQSAQGTEDDSADQMESGNAEDGDDTQSNASLDGNLACKLIDFKLSSSEQQQEQQQPPVDSSPGAARAEPESPGSSDEFQHTCPTCKKSFRHAATLSRHQKSHLQEIQAEEAAKKKGRQTARLTPSSSPKAGEGESQDEGTPEKEVNGSSVETSGAEEDERDRDREERSDEEEDSGSSESKGGDGENGAAGKTDKRKKICSMCNKRFWSLQDLTRHMRSHTGQSQC